MRFFDIDSFLVTSGAGFFGSHLCDLLIKDGQDAVCIDNFFSGHKRNVANLLRKNIVYIRNVMTFPLYLVISPIFNLSYPES